MGDHLAFATSLRVGRHREVLLHTIPFTDSLCQPGVELSYMMYIKPSDVLCHDGVEGQLSYTMCLALCWPAPERQGHVAQHKHDDTNQHEEWYEVVDQFTDRFIRFSPVSSVSRRNIIFLQ